MTLSVDFVIAVHDPRRPVLRALDSVLASGRDDVRVTVVCHGITPEDVPGLRERECELVRLVSFSDGIPSPAGPFNHGLDLATAEFVGVMGSDDWLAPGALDAWIKQCTDRELDLLFAGLQHQGGAPVRNPPVRPWRRNRLNPRKDRLFARAAPLGLIRRELVETPRLRFAEGLRTGEDIPFTTELLGRAQRIGAAFNTPRYVIGADAETRVTAAPHTVETVLVPVLAVFESEWFAAMPQALRTAAATARVRGSVLAHTVTRRDPSEWDLSGLECIRAALIACSSLAPDALEPFPEADRRLLEALERTVRTGPEAAEAVAQWHAASRRDHLLPRKLGYAFHRESTIVRYVGYALARVGA